MPYDYINCEVVEVHDGDTLTMNIDQGLNGHQYEALRLVDCWAPELNEPGGVAARDFLAAFCSVGGLQWRVFTFKAGKRGREKRTFTRYVADVHFYPPATDGSTTLSELMVNNGFATAEEKP